MKNTSKTLFHNYQPPRYYFRIFQLDLFNVGFFTVGTILGVRNLVDLDLHMETIR